MNWRLVKKVLQRRSTRTSAMHLQACRRYDRRMVKTGSGSFRPVDSTFVLAFEPVVTIEPCAIDGLNREVML